MVYVGCVMLILHAIDLMILAMKYNGGGEDMMLTKERREDLAGTCVFGGHVLLNSSHKHKTGARCQLWLLKAVTLHD
jgi:hypothetical protein